jgi:hypothetical protein
MKTIIPNTKNKTNPFDDACFEECWFEECKSEESPDLGLWRQSKEFGGDQRRQH